MESIEEVVDCYSPYQFQKFQKKINFLTSIDLVAVVKKICELNPFHDLLTLVLIVHQLKPILSLVSELSICNI